MDKILTHDFGKSLPPAMSFGGYVFIIAGLLAISTFITLGILFILFGSFVAFTRSGIQINIQNNTYRSYNSIFGLKQGKWKSLSDWTYITLLKNITQTAVFSMSNRQTLTPSELFYDITIFDSSYRKKMAIKRLKSKEDAIKDLKELSSILNLSIVRYPPKRKTKRSKSR